MTTRTLTSAKPTDPEHAAPGLAWRRPALLGSTAAAALALAWVGGWPGLLGAAAAAAAMGLAQRGVARGEAADSEPQPEPQEEPMAQTRVAGRAGAEVMVAQVVPVWSRQIEVTRDAATDGLARLLQTFADISGALNHLSQDLGAANLTASPGAVDGAVRGGSPALDALAAVSARAFTERDAAVADLARCADGLAELQQLAKQSRELARHTRLVAFNASIEAKRASGAATGQVSAGGKGAVADELRMLSERLADNGERIEQRVREVSGVIRKALSQGEIGNTTHEELRLEIDLKAREALGALLGGMGTALQGSAQAQHNGATLAAQIEEAFMHFQFGDRMSQMLSIVANDMTHFTQWVTTHPLATQNDAAQWLAALEGSYTMEEQRSIHHGNVHVEQSAGVEFF